MTELERTRRLPSGALDLAEVAGYPLQVLADRANQEHGLADQAMQSAAVHALNVGWLLLAAKARVDHGEWLPWLAENFKASERTAQSYMKLARADLDPQRAADLSLRALVRQLPTKTVKETTDEAPRSAQGDRPKHVLVPPTETSAITASKLPAKRPESTEDTTAGANANVKLALGLSNSIYTAVQHSKTGHPAST